MNEELKIKVEPFIPREPDWKQLYYNLALRITVASNELKNQQYMNTEKLLSDALDLIWRNEKAIETANSIVAVAQSDLPEGLSSWKEFRDKHEALLAEEKLKAAQGK